MHCTSDSKPLQLITYGAAHVSPLSVRQITKWVPYKASCYIIIRLQFSGKAPFWISCTFTYPYNDVRRSWAEEQQLFVFKKADFCTIPRDPAIIVAISILINPDANFKRILRSTNAVSDFSEDIEYARSAVTFFCSVRTDDIFGKCSPFLHCKDYFDLFTYSMEQSPSW